MVAHRRQELALARALGVGVGIFLLLWGPLSLIRWMGVGPFWTKIEAAFDVFFGLLLLLPYARVRSARLWRRLLGLLVVTSLLFVFVLVFDVLYVANLYRRECQPRGAARRGGKIAVCLHRRLRPQAAVPGAQLRARLPRA